MKEKIAIIAVGVNMVLAGGKIAVGMLSNSAAVLAAGIDSLVDIFSSSISYLGIKLSSRPADEKHPYGHYKFEVLGSIIITAIISLTGLGIIYNAYQNFLKPEKISLGYLTFGIMIFSALINEIMSRLKIYYGKKEGSLGLLSDGIHSKIDVYASLAILGGLFLTPYWIYADSALAFLMGIYIIREAFSIGKEALGSLLDVSAGKEIEVKIKQIAQKEKIEISSLKTQKKGSAITANLEIKLSDNLSVKEATQISDNLKKEILKNIKNLQYIAIQIKSHEMETSFYQPEIGRGFNWQRHGRFKKESSQSTTWGPNGMCICKKCSYQVPHQRGVPCAELKCPHCQINLKRK